MTRARLLATSLALALAALACDEPAPEPAPTPAPSPASSKPGPSAPLVLARGVRLTHAGPGADAARVIRDARARAEADGRELVVYVGATWCEPCRRFHAAAEAGELDDAFPNLTLLEFDLDADRDRLTSAGYRSDLIPLFVRPSADGRASDRRFEGSVKGPRAVANITPRLRALLAP